MWKTLRFKLRYCRCCLLITGHVRTMRLLCRTRHRRNRCRSVVAARGRNQAELLKQTERIANFPMLDNLAIGYPNNVNSRHRNFSARGWQIAEWTSLSASPYTARDDLISLSNQILRNHLEVRESSTSGNDLVFQFIQTGRYTWIVINEIFSYSVLQVFDLTRIEGRCSPLKLWIILADPQNYQSM